MTTQTKYKIELEGCPGFFLYVSLDEEEIEKVYLLHEKWADSRLTNYFQTKEIAEGVLALFCEENWHRLTDEHFLVSAYWIF